MAKLDLAVRAGQRECPRADLRIVILLDQRAHAVFVLRHDRRERHARRDAGRYPEARAEADDRIEHRAGRAGQRLGAGERGRRAHAAAAADEVFAVGFEFDGLAEARSPRQHVTHVQPRLVRSRTARADDGVVLGNGGRLDEQVAECRMRQVGGVRRQHDFGIAGELDVANATRVVGHGDAANLGIVFRRHRDFGEASRCPRRDGESPRDRARTSPRSCRRRGRSDESRRTRRHWRSAPRLEIADVAELPQASHVESSRQRVTAMSRQRVYPPPAFVTITLNDPFDNRCARGVTCAASRTAGPGDCTARPGASSTLCSSGGRSSGTRCGLRSCSSSSAACTRGSAWKRACMTLSFRQLLSATRLMPWWCAM